MREATGRTGWRSTTVRTTDRVMLVLGLLPSMQSGRLSTPSTPCLVCNTHVLQAQEEHARGHVCTNLQHFRSFFEKKKLRVVSEIILSMRLTVWTEVVGVRTLGLGEHFGSTAPPAVHHRSAGAPGAARALSPGTNTTWSTNKRNVEKQRTSFNT